MKALVKSKPQAGYELVDADKPVIKSNEILVKVDAVAICGSDIPLYEWNDIGRQIATLPFTPGHETTGIIEAIGADVDSSSFPIGARVAAETHIACSSCFQCRTGRPGLCDVMGLFGHGKGTHHGGCAQYTVLEPRFTYVLSHQSLEPRLAAVLEPFGVAHHAVEEAAVSGETVLILGAGPIGLFAAALAKHVFGARHVFVSDIVESRLEIARKVGADQAVHADDVASAVRAVCAADGGVGRVIECSGSTRALLSSYPLLRKRGLVMLVGLLKGQLVFEQPLPDLIFKCATLTSVHGRKIWHTWREAEHILAKKIVDLDPILSHEFPLERFDEAIRALKDGTACKIVINV